MINTENGSDVLWDRAGKYLNMIDQCESGGDKVGAMVRILKENESGRAAEISRLKEELRAARDALRTVRDMATDLKVCLRNFSEL